MERVAQFLKEAETYYLATVEGDQFIYAALSSKKVGNARLPQEKITIG